MIKLPEEYIKGCEKSLNESGLESFDILHEVVLEFKPKEILEIGTGWGISSGAFLYQTGVEKLITIDKIPDLEDFEVRMSVLGVRGKIERLIGDSCEVIPEHKEWEKRFDFIYVDGDHQYDGVSKDLENAWKCWSGKGCIVIDDFIHHANFESRYGVTKAVLEFIHKYSLNLKVYTKANGVAVLTK